MLHTLYWTHAVQIRVVEIYEAWMSIVDGPN